MFFYGVKCKYFDYLCFINNDVISDVYKDESEWFLECKVSKSLIVITILIYFLIVL